MKLWQYVLLALFLAGVSVILAEAGSYTVTVPDRADQALTWYGARMDPPMTAQDLVQSKMIGLLRMIVDEHEKVQRRDACEEYAKLTDVQKTAIRTQLGGKDPC